MQPPDRVSVPTCIGCGAMNVFGTCDRGCSEEKLELVQAADCDRLVALTAEAGGRVDEFRTVIEELACAQPGPIEYESAYRSTQGAARQLLRRHPELDARTPDRHEPAGVATTWWCPRCGAIDAPQPCLGICIWRSIDWVNVRLYKQERGRALAACDTELRFRQLLRRAASVTPRERQWEHGWRVLQAQAQQALE
jgi:hypothetical protein